MRDIADNISGPFQVAQYIMGVTNDVGMELGMRQ